MNPKTHETLSKVPELALVQTLRRRPHLRRLPQSRPLLRPRLGERQPRTPLALPHRPRLRRHPRNLRLPLPLHPRNRRPTGPQHRAGHGGRRGKRHHADAVEAD